MIWRIGRAQTMWTDSSDGVNPVYNVPASIRLHAVFNARPKWFHPLTHNPGTGPCCFHRLESFPINLPWIHKCKGLFEGRIYWMMVQRFQNGNSSDGWSEATTDMSNRGAAGERRWICVFVYLYLQPEEEEVYSSSKWIWQQPTWVTREQERQRR